MKKKYIQFEDGSAVLKKEKKIGVKELVISIVLALLLFICLLVIESSFLSKYDKTTVVVAKCTVPKSTQITEKNIGLYFEEKEIPANLVPQSAIFSKDTLINKIVSLSINQGEILMENRFLDEQKYLAKISNPMEMGISVSSAAQAAGGTIRRGDIVNIYVVDTQTKQSTEILHEAYVCRAFNQEGIEIAGENAEDQCMEFVIYIDSMQEQFVSEKIDNGNIYINKVLRNEYK